MPIYKCPRCGHVSNQKGDMKKTHANVNKLHKYIKFKPSTSIRKGILEFVRLYKKYYKK